MRIIYLFIILLVSSCTSTVERIELPTNNEPPTLTIVVGDKSKSATYIPIPIDELKAQFYDDALHGGAQVAAFNIQENSQKQSPWMSEIIKARTVAVDGNFYHRNRIIRENEQTILDMKIDLNRIIDSIDTKLIVKRTIMYSDVNGALLMVTQLANYYSAKGYKIRILIFSDLLQDTSETSTLNPVTIIEAAKIILIGGHLDFDESKVFPNNTIEKTPVFKFN